MAIPSLSEAIIRQQVTDQSFQRGQDYYCSGAVSALVQRGGAIQAEVEGSQYESYHVTLSFDAGQAKYYRHAVGWLNRACRAYLAAGRQAD
jgi:uncharacterized Zn finger protein